jgi:hypothetical protein
MKRSNLSNGNFFQLGRSPVCGSVAQPHLHLLQRSLPEHGWFPCLIFGAK